MKTTLSLFVMILATWGFSGQSFAQNDLEKEKTAIEQIEEIMAKYAAQDIPLQWDKLFIQRANEMFNSVQAYQPSVGSVEEKKGANNHVAKIYKLFERCRSMTFVYMKFQTDNWPEITDELNEPTQQLFKMVSDKLTWVNSLEGLDDKVIEAGHSTLKIVGITTEFLQKQVSRDPA